MQMAVHRALELAKSTPVAALAPEDETALAIVRLLEILGEAARSVSSEFKAAHPEIPWREMAGLRNKLIHEYFDVDMAIVAAIVENELPDLAKKLEDLLRFGELE